MINIDNLNIILNHVYDDEIKYLESDMNCELPDDLEDSIKFCEEKGYTDYIAYNLMILKKDLQDELKRNL